MAAGLTSVKLLNFDCRRHDHIISGGGDVNEPLYGFIGLEKQIQTQHLSCLPQNVVRGNFAIHFYWEQAYRKLQGPQIQKNLYANTQDLALLCFLAGWLKSISSAQLMGSTVEVALLDSSNVTSSQGFKPGD